MDDGVPEGNVHVATIQLVYSIDPDGQPFLVMGGDEEVETLTLLGILALATADVVHGGGAD
jgi:hypothetical protein